MRSFGRLFQNADRDKTGNLDSDEFQSAFAEVGIRLSDFEVKEVMAEVDLDLGGTIDCDELMDKLKQVRPCTPIRDTSCYCHQLIAAPSWTTQFGRERFERSEKCRTVFDEIDADGSG